MTPQSTRRRPTQSLQVGGSCLHAALQCRKLKVLQGTGKADMPFAASHVISTATLRRSLHFDGQQGFEIASGCSSCSSSCTSSAVCTGPPASVGGSWSVVGNSGAVGIQALPFTNELVLFIARPLNENGGGDASLTNLLTVWPLV